MSLTTRISELATRIGAEIKQLRTEIGSGGGGASVAIDDSVPTGDETMWYQPSQGRLAILVDGQWVDVGRNGLDGEDGAPGVDGEDGEGGGTNFIQATGNTSSANIANIEVDLVWNTPEFTDSVLSISATAITINTTGKYKFTVTFMTQGSARVEAILRTYVNTGSGYVTKYGAVARNYVSRDYDQEYGTVTLTYILSLSASDVVKFSAEANADGTAVLLDNGTVLIIEKLA